MKKRMSKCVVSIVCVLAMLLSWGASAQTDVMLSEPVEPISTAFEDIGTLPQNIQSLLSNVQAGDVLVPNDNLYELTVKHADGSYTTEVYSVPVKYTDDEGEVPVY